MSGNRITEEYADDQLQCRTFGHRWDWQRVEKRPGQSWGVDIELSCIGCEMVRVDTIDSRGFLSKRRYLQPEGYRAPGVDRRRAELLTEFEDRLLSSLRPLSP